MNTHDWSTPLIRFRVHSSFLRFYEQEEYSVLTDLVQIKPDKVRGMRRALEANREVRLLCRPDQFAYVVAELNRLPVRPSLRNLEPEIIYPPDNALEMDIVHATLCLPPKGKR